jgi:hypothetical protein
MKTPTGMSGALIVIALATPASAQYRTPHEGYFTVNAASQPGGASLSDHFEFERNVETATADVQYPSKAGAGIDAGAGIRLWKRLGAGLSVSYLSSTGPASIDASIPHPFMFDQPRLINGTADSIARTETGAHAQLLYFVPGRGKLRLVLSGGPSWLKLEQEFVTEVHYSESYPFDTATFTRATTTGAHGSAIGFNAGADVRWMFSRQLAVGALVRLTRAQVDIDLPAGRTLPVDAGGVQAGGGIRFLF